MYISNLQRIRVEADGDIHMDGQSILVEDIHIFFRRCFINLVNIDVVPGCFHMPARDNDMILVQSDTEFVKDYGTFSGADRIKDAGG